jgi:hypothetical protein
MGFSGPRRKEWTDEAIEILREADRPHHPTGRSRYLYRLTSVDSSGVSEDTFYAWKEKYAHLGVSELRRLCQVEEENVGLKRLVGDLSLDKPMLSKALRKQV